MNNKSKIIKALCILSAAAVMTASFTACGNKSEGGFSDSEGSFSDTASDTAEKPVKVGYSCNEIKFSENLGDLGVGSFSVTDSSMTFILYEYSYDEETQSDTTFTYLCTADFDGNIISKTDISPEKVNDTDWADIQYINFLDDGTMIFLESHYYTISISPDLGVSDEDGDDDSELLPLEDEIIVENMPFVDGQETEVYENKQYIVHMAADGSVIDRKDTSEIPVLADILSSDNSSIGGMTVNGKGEISVTYQTYDENWNSTSGIMVMDNELEQIFNKELSDSNSWINGSFADSDGNFNFVIYSYDFNGDGENSQKLYRPDYTTGELTEIFDWKSSSSDAMAAGSGDYLAYYFDYNTVSIMGLKSDGSSDTVIDLLDNGLYISSVDHICADGDDFYITAYTSTGNVMYSLKKLDESEVKEKTTVTLAAYYAPSELSSAVAEYNRSDGNYIISVTDYSQYNDYSSDDEEAWNAGMTKLNSEISAGQIPDIISISDPEMLSSLSEKGLFLDLNTFIDGENGLDRSEYFDNVFRAMETDGKLYALTSSFGIMGFSAKQSFIPEDGAVTWEQVDSVLSQNSGMSLFSQETSRGTFMMMTFACGSKSFINASAGECSFDSPEFVEIIERSADYPQEVDYDSLNSDPDYWENYQTQFRNNSVLLNNFYMYNFDSYYQEADANMGEDISIIGMPGSGGGACLVPSSYISISSQSEYPDAGWELIKSILEYDEDRFTGSDYYSVYFPVNKKSFRQMGEAAIEASYYTDDEGNKVQSENTYYINDTEFVNVRNVDTALIDRTESFISSVDNVYMGIDSSIADIIDEETAAFYAGTVTAQQAADNIQNRASLYLSEHS